MQNKQALLIVNIRRNNLNLNFISISFHFGVSFWERFNLFSVNFHFVWQINYILIARCFQAELSKLPLRFHRL